MQGDEALRLGIEFEHREVHHPQGLPTVLDEAEVASHLQSQCTQHIAHRLVRTRAKQQQVTRRRRRGCEDSLQRLGIQELGYRRVHAFQSLGRVLDAHPGQALGAVPGCKRAQFIYLLAREHRTTGNAQRRHATGRIIGRFAEHLELDLAHVFGDIDQFQRDAQVRLVRTVARHRLGIAHARERPAQIDIGHFPENVADHGLDSVLYPCLVNEGELHVELGEFRLAIRAQVLVAETACNLVVAVKARHHQQLLEQLRRLRQGVELARMHTARHQVVARALRGCLGQDRRLDILKSTPIQVMAQGGNQPCAHAHLALHVCAAQVKVAVLEPGVLGGILVQRKRQSHRLVQYLYGLRKHFHLAAAQLVIGADAPAHTSFNTHAEFISQLRGLREGRFRFALDDDLHNAFVVAKVDEGHVALQAHRIDPTAQADGLADQGLVDDAAIVAAHGKLRGKARNAIAEIAALQRLPGPTRSKPSHRLRVFDQLPACVDPARFENRPCRW